MKNILKFLLFLVAWIPFGVLHSALPNWNFEQPVMGNSFQYFPTKSVASWEFPSGDGSGISGPGSAFTYANNLNGRGQVAFIQGHGAFKTSVTTSGGTYIVTMSAAQRGAEQLGTQTITVLVDGVVRGTFTPRGAEMENYSTPEFALGAGSHHLELRGSGSGADFTAFIDDVSLVKVEQVSIGASVASKTSSAVKCDEAVADFGVNFAPPRDPRQAYVRVRHMDKARIVSSRSWYDASVNTLIDANREGCSRGPYEVPTGPNNLSAQSTFQMVDDEVGFLLLMRDARDSMNPHVMYGFEDQPVLLMPWKSDGDAVEIRAMLRVSMFNSRHVAGEVAPVAQVYLAVNAMHAVSGKAVQFSVMAYDSRTGSHRNLCDHYTGADGPHAVIQTTFSPHSTLCSGEKFVWVAGDTTQFTAGGDLPESGVWQELRPFSARFTTETLRRALAEANLKQGGFDPEPANYRLHATAFIVEAIKFDVQDDLDVAVALGGFSVRQHTAQ